MSDIKFGTDGWRGIIGRDFTFENVRTVSQAIADYFKTIDHASKNIVIGYDLRFLSEKYALTAAKVLSGNSFKVLLSKNAVSTPATSLAIVNNKAMGGVMVTASHNSYDYNGIKIKTCLGGGATEKETKKVEELLGKNPVSENADNIIGTGFEEKYFKKLASLVDMKAVNRSKFKVVIDPMYGSSQGYLLKILENSKLNLIPIHHMRSANFGGINPEPIEPNLEELKTAVKKTKSDIGLAADGDGDRIAIADDSGNYLSAQHIIPLLLLHLIENKKWKGGVVKTISTTFAVEAIAKAYNLKVYYTPVGFKHIADLMIKEDILIGGEESGGIGIKNYIPERDGVLNGLLLLEMLAQTGKKVSRILKDIEKKYGKFCYDRVDIKYPPENRDKVTGFLKTAAFEKMLGQKVKEINRSDGTKFIMEDNSWLLLRASGTEPILRIYSESSSLKKVHEFLNFGVKTIRSL